MPTRPAPRAHTVQKAPSPSPPKVAPRWLRPLVLVLAAVLLIGMFSRPFGHSDAWWHLKTGQYIVETHKLPVPDPFSFTTASSRLTYPGEEQIRHFNLTHEWLSQVVFYLVYSVGGFGGVVLMRALLVSLFCALVGLTAQYRGAGFYGSLAAALLAASVMPILATDRPQVITYALLALTVYLLETRRFLWALPPIFLFWANAHGGFVIGWIAIGAYCAESLFLRWRGKPVADERRLWLVAVASVAVAALNPNGLRIIQVLMGYHRSPLQSTLIEWQPTNYWEISPFNGVLYGSMLILVWARGKARVVDCLMLTLFAVAALTSVRNIFLIALAGPLILVTYFPWKPRVPRLAEFAIALLLAVAVVLRLMNPSAYQFRADESLDPKGAADFLLAHHITGRMYNTYVDGGYLIWRLWPQEKVFTDGRALSESAFEDATRIQNNAAAVNGKSAEQLLNDYGIEVIVMEGFEYFMGSIYYLPAALSDPSQKEWKLVYQDDAAMVFMRHPPPDVLPLNSLEALTSMEDQCSNHISGFPIETGCARELGKLFSTIGDPVRARKWETVNSKQ
jgi:MFS family permease